MTKKSTAKSKFKAPIKAEPKVRLPEPKRNWSNLQKTIFIDIAKGIGHTVVVARAGSGKTSTIVEGFKYVPRGKKTLMVAFNKSIAEKLKLRAPSYVDCMTLHSLGFRAIKQAFGNVVFDNKKMQFIFESLIGDGSENWDLNMSLCKCASLCKGFLFDSPSKISELIEKFGIELCDLKEEVFIKHVIKALALAKNQKMIIDFDDMIWFPFVYRLNVGKFDFVFIDELQDLNQAQISMSLSACRTGGRIVGVGDDYQSIYQFRGADSEAIPYVIKILDAKVLPLSITYRCPTKVVNLAQEIVKDIEAHPSAPEGKVEWIFQPDLLKLVKPGDFVLSRTNAPLIKNCMALLKMGVPANIQGRDIGANLLYFIKKSKAKTIDKFIEYVESWKKAELSRLIAEKKDPSACIDKAECLSNLCEDCPSIQTLKDNIEKLFADTDDQKKVVFSTTHKAKGLERDRVFILRWTYRYGPGVTGEEANLYYVAVTRAKKELYLVNKVNKSDKYDDFSVEKLHE